MHTVVMLNVIMMSVVTFNAIKLSVDTLNIIMLSVVALLSFNKRAHLKNVKNYLNTNIYSYLGTLDGQSSNLYLNVV
jgi:hypothetical protein